MKQEKIKKADELKIYLKKYCEERKLFIKNVGFMSPRLHLTGISNPEKENLSDYYIDDWLNATISGIEGKDSFFKFAKHLIKNKRLDLADVQLKQKRPSGNEDFKTYFESVFNWFKSEKEVIRNFVFNKRFFDVCPNKLEFLCNYFEDQKDRAALFENLFKTKWFSVLNNQIEVYRVLQKQLENPESYSGFFQKINISGDLKEEDAFSKTEVKFCREMVIDFKKLMSASVDQKINIKGYNCFLLFLNNFKTSYSKLGGTEESEGLRVISENLQYTSISLNENKDVAKLTLTSKIDNLDHVLDFIKFTMLNLKDIKEIEKLNNNMIWETEYWEEYLKNQYVEFNHSQLKNEIDKINKDAKISTKVKI